MRVGYVPYSAALDQPADRRRFPFYAARRGLGFELADPGGDYDVVVVTPRTDLAAWAGYRRGKLVFDLVDSYLAIPRTDPKALLRGPAKFVTGEARRPLHSHRRALERILERADAVTCATPEQARMIAPFCADVHPILDFHSGLVHHVKDRYDAGSPLRLVWEGLGENARWFSEIGGALRRVHRRHPLELHLVTSPQHHRFAQRIGRRDTAAVVARHFGDVRLHEWREESLSALATDCDIAVIPLPLDRPLEAGKPESKLVSFWRMGLPTITSATPAYVRVMEACGQDLACATEAEWEAALLRLVEDRAAREQAGVEGRAFAEREYADDRLLAAWDRVFASL